MCHSQALVGMWLFDNVRKMGDECYVMKAFWDQFGTGSEGGFGVGVCTQLRWRGGIANMAQVSFVYSAR